MVVLEDSDETGDTLSARSSREEEEEERVYTCRKTVVLGLDPGLKNLGVCFYHLEKDRVEHLVEFNLKDYTPCEEDKGISCFSTKNAVTTNLGLCVISLIGENLSIFRPDLYEPEGDIRLMVGIEKQMNENPDNCCVLTAFQTYYETQGIECFVLNTNTLNKCFTGYFLGTVKNRPLRKRRIRDLGYLLLRSEENTSCMKYQKRHVDVPIPEGSRKRGRMKPSEHALDAMFYAFVVCVNHEDISTDPVDKRQRGNKKLIEALKDIVNNNTSIETEVSKRGRRWKNGKGKSWWKG